MFVSCEQAIKLTLPAVRIAVAEKLSIKGVNQSDIAKILGVAQPAVNKYLKHRYSSKVETVKEFIKKKGFEKEITELALARNNKSDILKRIDRVATQNDVVELALNL